MSSVSSALVYPLSAEEETLVSLKIHLLEKEYELHAYLESITPSEIEEMRRNENNDDITSDVTSSNGDNNDIDSDTRSNTETESLDSNGMVNVVRGLKLLAWDKDKLSLAKENIEKLLDNSSTKMTLDQYETSVFFYLFFRMKADILNLKDEFGLDLVVFATKKSKKDFYITLSGKRANVKEAVKKLEGLVKSICKSRVIKVTEDVQEAKEIYDRIAKRYADTKIFVSVFYTKGALNVAIYSNKQEDLEPTLSTINEFHIRKYRLIDETELGIIEEYLNEEKLNEIFGNYDTIVKLDNNQVELVLIGLNKGKTSQVKENIFSVLSSSSTSISKYALPHSLHKLILMSNKEYINEIEQKARCKISLNVNQQCLMVNGTEDQIKVAFKLLKDLFDRQLCIVRKEFHEQDQLFIRWMEKSIPPKLLSSNSVEVSASRITIETTNGKLITIINGDIFENSDNIDAIVNPANSQLKHVGGLSKAILERAGPSMEKESKQIINMYGGILTGHVVTTSAGNLNFKQIIHAVGPVYTDGGSSEVKELQSCMTSILERMKSEELRSVVLPTLSSGIFQYPSIESTKILLETTISWLENNPSQIQEIRFCDTNETVLKHYRLHASRITAVPGSSITYGTTTDSSTTTSTTSTSTTATTKSPTPTNTYFQWSWSHESGVMKDYDDLVNSVIEKAYQQNIPHIDITLGRFDYRINFTRMAQINLSTMNSRKLMRTLVSKKNTRKMKYYFKITGLLSRVNEVYASLKEYFMQKVVETCVNVDIMNMNQTSIDSVLTNYGVTARILSDRYFLRGLKDDVSKAEKDINKLVAEGKSVMYPSTWEEQDVNVKLFVLPSTSSEYLSIQKEVNKTLPTASISKIIRIQNKMLYELYSKQKQIMDKKNGILIGSGYSNEQLLFYGIYTNPQLIYNSIDGFYPVVGDNTLWGYGNYFAIRAAYADGRAKPLPSGEKQLFYAQVLVGHSKLMPQDKTMKMPPLKENQSGIFCNERYDSVTAQVTTIDVNYVIYDLGRAYPTYLITYKN
eukprot:TRINITY_DN5257_c0_g4_i1.p1 TRINITY_DN5257_c0_g4~~TRINITY_DN5257_c0_g4_i1.p1  ORF type:complete len:1124 (-),score=257.59 TRINITY_DN5257_c0_g4_i1:134-3214(-)